MYYFNYITKFKYFPQILGPQIPFSCISHSVKKVDLWSKGIRCYYYYYHHWNSITSKHHLFCKKKNSFSSLMVKVLFLQNNAQYRSLLSNTVYYKCTIITLLILTGISYWHTCATNGYSRKQRCRPKGLIKTAQQASTV